MNVKRQIAVKSFNSISEKEALALLQMSSSRKGGTFEAIRLKILDLVSKGQNYGQIAAETSSHEALTPLESKQIMNSINSTFKRTNVKFGLRYIAPKDIFVYAPEEKLTELFGKS